MWRQCGHAWHALPTGATAAGYAGQVIHEIPLQARALSLYTAYNWTLCLCYGMMVEGQSELLQCVKLATAQLASGLLRWLDIYSPCRPVYSRASSRAARMPCSIDASIAGTRSCIFPAHFACRERQLVQDHKLTPGDLCSAHSMNAYV